MTIKLFIKNILLFFSFLFALLIVSFAILNLYHYLFLNEIRLSSNVKTLFVGDSQIQTAINDRLIENSINISSTAESYYFNYYKLKNYLSSNSQIKKVYLGISYHNLSNYYDDFIYGKQSVNISSGYFFILPTSERIECLVWNADQPFLFIKKIVLSDFSKIFKNKSEGYVNNFVNVIPSTEYINRKLKSQFYNNGKLDAFSEINLDYLDRIINLCKTKKIDLIFLTTPLHKYYRDNIPDVYRNKYNEIIKSKKIEVIDLNSLHLDDDCFIPDGVHVSQKGAIITTEQLKQIIQ
jgi:hypothetical protein